MAKSTWKFLSTVVADKYIYLIDYLNLYFDTFLWRQKRNITFNNLNVSYLYSIHQGKVDVSVFPISWHISFKTGAFTKTRKPFFFRSKKKKR